jgi:glycosyltransferase involved in cell wall biosynthesis
MAEKKRITVIMPIHNEAKYLPDCLKSIKAIENQFFEFIFIIDRCTDNSEAIVREWFPNATIVNKEVCKWKNSLAENYQIGLGMSKGEIICTHDADATSPPNILPLLIELTGNVASVSSEVVTWKKASFLNRLYYYWEKTRKFAPFGEEPRGAFRLIRKDAIEKVGGFKDVSAQETQLDIDLRKAGFQSILVKGVVSYHLRRISLRKSIRTQIRNGQMRRQFEVPFWKVLGHAVIRLRPFILYGYIFSKKEKNFSSN